MKKCIVITYECDGNGKDIYTTIALTLQTMLRSGMAHRFLCRTCTNMNEVCDAAVDAVGWAPMPDFLKHYDDGHGNGAGGKELREQSAVPRRRWSADCTKASLDEFKHVHGSMDHLYYDAYLCAGGHWDYPAWLKWLQENVNDFSFVWGEIPWLEVYTGKCVADHFAMPSQKDTQLWRQEAADLLTAARPHHEPTHYVRRVLWPLMAEAGVASDTAKPNPSSSATIRAGACVAEAKVGVGTSIDCTKLTAAVKSVLSPSMTFAFDRNAVNVQDRYSGARWQVEFSHADSAESVAAKVEAEVRANPKGNR